MTGSSAIATSAARSARASTAPTAGSMSAAGRRRLPRRPSRCRRNSCASATATRDRRRRSSVQVLEDAGEDRADRDDAARADDEREREPREPARVREPTRRPVSRRRAATRGTTRRVRGVGVDDHREQRGELVEEVQHQQLPHRGAVRARARRTAVPKAAARATSETDRSPPPNPTRSTTKRAGIAISGIAIGALRRDGGSDDEEPIAPPSMTPF